MMIKDNFNLSYDLSGNLIITIPKVYISEDWSGDSAADIAGICESDVNDGSVNHDRYIYGLE